ncbi:MAG: hypothetical protein ACYDDA_12420 [Acidiferrobacteraceae bacterium]
MTTRNGNAAGAALLLVLALGVATRPAWAAPAPPAPCQQNTAAARSTYDTQKAAVRAAVAQVQNPGRVDSCLAGFLGTNFDLGYTSLTALFSRLIAALENMACGVAQGSWNRAVTNTVPGGSLGWGAPVVGQVAGVSGGAGGTSGTGISGQGSTLGGGSLGGSSGNVGSWINNAKSHFGF